jgi:hypothetical protein
MYKFFLFFSLGTIPPEYLQEITRRSGTPDFNQAGNTYKTIKVNVYSFSFMIIVVIN